MEFMLPDVEVFDYSLEGIVVPMPMYVSNSKEDSDSFALEMKADQMLQCEKSCLLDEVSNDLQHQSLDFDDKHKHEMDLHVINNSFNTYIPHVTSQKVNCSCHCSQNSASHFQIITLIEHALKTMMHLCFV